MCPGNVYGKQRPPADIEQEISCQSAWERYTSSPSSPEDAPQGTMPGELHSPSHSPPQAPSPPEQGSGEETGSMDEEESSDPVQQSGSTDDSNNSNEQVEAALTSLVEEGGVRYLNLLLAKAEDRKSTRLNSSHRSLYRMPSSA